jgi:hypothetical protein
MLAFRHWIRSQVLAEAQFELLRLNDFFFTAWGVIGNNKLSLIIFTLLISTPLHTNHEINQGLDGITYIFTNILPNLVIKVYKI